MSLTVQVSNNEVTVSQNAASSITVSQEATPTLTVSAAGLVGPTGVQGTQGTQGITGAGLQTPGTRLLPHGKQILELIILN